MILTDAEVSSLKSALGFWEWFGYISTELVMLGCLGEFITEFASSPEDEHTRKKFTKLYLLVLILGIAGELLSAAGTSHFSGQLIANIEDRARTAEQKAGEANDRAEANKKEAEQLRKDAEVEHLARVKIEAAVAWRSLGDKQKRDIGAALSRFSSKAGASIWFNASSTEAEIFAGDIAEALRIGHITTTAPGGLMEMSESSGKWGEAIKSATTGVILQSTRDPSAQKFALALIKELTDRGFDAKRQTDPPFDDKVKAPIIWVNVEPRPRGPQGEFKLQAEQEAKQRIRKQTK